MDTPTTTQRYATDKALRGLPHVQPHRHNVQLTDGERMWLDVTDRAAMLDTHGIEPVDDRSEYLAPGVRSRWQSERRVVAGERPWTDSDRTFGTRIGTLGRYLGSHLVTDAPRYEGYYVWQPRSVEGPHRTPYVVSEGADYVQLAPVAWPHAVGKGPDGEPNGTYITTNTPAGTNGRNGGRGGRPRTYASNADKQRAYRRRVKVRELVERYGHNERALDKVETKALTAMLKRERNAVAANARSEASAPSKVETAVAVSADRGW